MTLNKQTLADKTRKDFPFLKIQADNQSQLIYLDHAATSQKPYQVINKLREYYIENNANVHRGAHQLSAKATKSFEESRDITSKFINASSAEEIIFTRNATEAINLVSHSWGSSNLQKGDEILLSIMEHHSNIVPWQLLAERTGCILRYIGITEQGELDIDDLNSKINHRTKLISIVHISNTLGCCNPIAEITQIAHKVGALVLVDACQSLAHKKINVDELDIDFLAGSSHKLCGPTGIGFLWGKKNLLEKMSPFLGGGEMIQEVFLDKSSWAELPHKFEAGTPAIGEAVAMGSALKYLQSIDLDTICKWEKELVDYLFEKLIRINDVQILGPVPQEKIERGALTTFTVKGLHANDISELLDTQGICIRSGHHCCQPLHRFYGINSSARASLSFITTKSEIDTFTDELQSAINFLKKNS